MSRSILLKVFVYPPPDCGFRFRPAARPRFEAGIEAAALTGALAYGGWRDPKLGRSRLHDVGKWVLFLFHARMPNVIYHTQQEEISHSQSGMERV